jgi:hypothetical protein
VSWCAQYTHGVTCVVVIAIRCLLVYSLIMELCWPSSVCVDLVLATQILKDGALYALIASTTCGETSLILSLVAVS